MSGKRGKPSTGRGGQVWIFDTNDYHPWERCYILEALKDGLISVYFDTENRKMVLTEFCIQERLYPFRGGYYIYKGGNNNESRRKTSPCSSIFGEQGEFPSQKIFWDDGGCLYTLQGHM